jgi:hypothetical protein
MVALAAASHGSICFNRHSSILLLSCGVVEVGNEQGWSLAAICSMLDHQNPCCRTLRPMSAGRSSVVTLDSRQMVASR